MQVILLEQISNLGNPGAQVSVKAGYGRNYLIPQHKAVPASAENIEKYRAMLEELQRQAAGKKAEALERAEKINALSIGLTVKAGEEGKLFGSVTVRDIADAVTARGIQLDRSDVRLPDGPIREIGDYEVVVHLHSEVNAAVRVSLIAET